jgi:Na+/H+-dicarboxylate symporter
VGKSRLHWWILLGMGVGVVAGYLVHRQYGPEIATTTAVWRAFDGVATVFLRLLKMIVLPLVFFSLVSGMQGMGNLARLGRMGVKTLVLYLTTSLLALLTGLTLVNLVRPGVGFETTLPVAPVSSETPDSLWSVVAEMVPENVFRAAAEFDLLGVIVFALFFGVFLLATGEKRKRTLVALIEGGSEVMMRMTRFIISLAPVGIAALIARTVSSTGVTELLEMGWYVATVFLGLAIHALVALPLLLAVVRRRNPYPFLRAMSPALLTGFSTASSSGTLSVTLERAEHGAGISNRVASFVLPLGATINMDGTALYELVSVLFIAQLHAAADPAFTLTIGQQALIVFLGLTVSIGAAGIPHAGLVMMVIILQAVGLPVEYVGLIWMVDRVLDMCRTAVNITSDSTITMIIAHTEGEVDESVLAAN